MGFIRKKKVEDQEVAPQPAEQPIEEVEAPTIKEESVPAKHQPRFVAFANPAKEGIYDIVTQKPFVENIWEALADIKNDLSVIKKLIEE